MDRRRLVGKREELGVLDRVVPSAMGALAALPQQPDHLHRLLEHLEADVGAGPSIAEDMLVERLARAHAEPEAPRHHRGHRRRRLGDDRRMDADRRTRHRGVDTQVARLGGDPAEHGPDEGTLRRRRVRGKAVLTRD